VVHKLVHVQTVGKTLLAGYQSGKTLKNVGACLSSLDKSAK
jgi:hypothetical protein